MSTLSEDDVKRIFEEALKDISQGTFSDILDGKGREEKLYPLYVKQFLENGFRVIVNGGFYRNLSESSKRSPDYKVDLLIVKNGNLIGIEVKGPSVEENWSIRGTPIEEDKKKLQDLMSLGYLKTGFFVGIFLNRKTTEFEVHVEKISQVT